MRQWLISSRSCVNIKGELSQYFFCKRGVRQGDLLSPVLYILAADSLCKIFNKARQNDLIIGLGPQIQGKAVTNCHYADDTFLFLDADPLNIQRAWWSMLAFEWLSGIKINQN